MGFTRDDLRALTARWPNVDDEVLLDVAISNVVANLIGHPRGLPNEWRRYIDAEPSDLADQGDAGAQVLTQRRRN
jgi:hypothetical protein